MEMRLKNTSCQTLIDFNFMDTIIAMLLDWAFSLRHFLIIWSIFHIILEKKKKTRIKYLKVTKSSNVKRIKIRYDSYVL